MLQKVRKQGRPMQKVKHSAQIIDKSTYAFSRLY